MGELLAAHRALEAVDVDRPRGRCASRCAPCSARATRTSRRSTRRSSRCSGTGEVPRAPNPIDELGGSSARRSRARPSPSNRAGAQTDEEPEPVPAAYSDVELLRHKDFAEMTDAELAAANRMLARLALRGPTRRSRRMQAPRAAARTGPICVARCASSLRHGGEPRRAPLARPDGEAAPGRARARRLGLDDAVRAGDDAVPARVRRRAPPRRGVRVRHAPHAHHARARGPRPRRGAAPRDRRRSSTSRAARASAPRSPSSTARTGGASAAARS